MYIHIHTCVYTYTMHICMFAHIHTCIVHIYTNVYIIHTCLCTCTYMHMYMHTCMCTHVHMHTCMCIHIYIHMHVYRHTHSYTLQEHPSPEPPLSHCPSYAHPETLVSVPQGLAGGKCHFGSITRPLRHLGTINSKFNFHMRRRGQSTVTKEPGACALIFRVQPPWGQEGGRCHHAVSSGFPAMAGLNNSSMLSLLGTTVLGESTPAAACLLRGPLPAAFFC